MTEFRQRLRSQEQLQLNPSDDLTTNFRQPKIMTRKKPAETWQDILKNDKTKPRKNRIESLPKHLKGPAQNRYGGHQSSKMKPLKGSKLGAASACRSYSLEEIAQFENDLRTKGLLSTSTSHKGKRRV
jgi:ABC-type uncharacterized transport system involved in gliding motility auxiliary subunit